jgi:glycosyltransferase involved in cell wall biosynthesis
VPSPSSGRSPRRVFLNAGNVTATGATMLVRDLLPALYAALPEAEFTTLVPQAPTLVAAAVGANARVLTRDRRRGAPNDLARLLDVHVGLPRLVRAARADVCLTLGDLGPSRLSCPHVLFLHNPHFVYSPGELAGHDAWSPAKRRYMQWQMGRALGRAEAVIVQTPVMQSRLAARFGVEPARIRVIPQPAPRHVAGAPTPPGHSPLAACGKPVRLLFLAAYYPHKNHRILPGVVREIRARGLAGAIHIFVTLGTRAPASLRAALAQCPDVITDLDQLPPTSVSAALADASALFLPTLVESYGLIYLEAMVCGRPILTSDRDFARWMCRDAAGYFDPLDERSIVDAIVGLAGLGDPAELGKKAAARLAELPPDWQTVGNRFAEVLRCALRS